MNRDPILSARTIPGAMLGELVPMYFAVNGGLHYIKGNAAPYFSLTYTAHRSGHPTQRESGGAGHDTIAKVYGDRFADLAALHLADIDGVPLHAEGNGWYWMAGALGGAGERFHGANGDRYRPTTPDESLATFARLVRIPIEEAERLRDELRDEHANNPDGWQAARATLALRLDDMRPRWKAEADAAIARHGLRVYGDPWTPPEPEPEPTPRMMPGQEPYTDEERHALYRLVSDAAAGDPGETAER